MIIVPIVGATALLDDLLDDVTTWYHLYVTDITLSVDTVLGDFVEASFPGYLPLLVSTWAPSLWDVDRAVSNADPAVWTRGGPPSLVTVYGYYVTDGMVGPLLWCERRTEGGIVLNNPGEQCQVLPKTTLHQSPD